MPAESWTLVSLVTAVQVLSEGVFFAQGILSDEETNGKSSGQNEFDWVRICVPLFYAATRQISEPCWRWILGGYGDRMTTALGAATIAVSVVAASSQEAFLGNAAYIILGGIGMGLVRLQLKLMRSTSGDARRSLWGSGVSGIGLSLWPLLACLFVRSFGPRYAMLILAGITLHAVPLAIFVKPVEEDQSEDPENGAAVRSSTELKQVPFSSQLQEYRLISQLMEYNSYRVRPSYYVEVLPGIPEEVEHDSENERDHEMQRTIPVSGENGEISKGKGVSGKSSSRKKERGKKSKGLKIERTKTADFEGEGVEAKPFAYTLFVTTILLRLGDQFGVVIVVSFLPIFAGYLMPNIRLQEKAFLISLCGFSKILAEFPLLGLYIKSKKTKLVSVGGPLFAAVGLYLTWNSASLDTMTLASFGLGIGSGAASATLQILAPRESSCNSDIADIVVGSALLAIIPLTRIFILGHAIQGCLLLAAGIYVAAAITSVFTLRREA